MVTVKNANAMAEVIYYLKGIRQEDLDKIPKKFIKYLNENASKEYECNFDYNKPLKELELLDETRGIIGMICYNYWCVTENQKEQYLRKINQNEKRHQEELLKKYDPDNIFKENLKHDVKVESENNLPIVAPKDNFFKRIINYIKNLFKNN